METTETTLEETSFARELGQEAAKAVVGTAIAWASFLAVGFTYGKYLERKERKSQTVETTE